MPQLTNILPESAKQIAHSTRPVTQRGDRPPLYTCLPAHAGPPHAALPKYSHSVPELLSRRNAQLMPLLAYIVVKRRLSSTFAGLIALNDSRSRYCTHHFGRHFCKCTRCIAWPACLCHLVSARIAPIVLVFFSAWSFLCLVFSLHFMARSCLSRRNRFYFMYFKLIFCNITHWILSVYNCSYK
jgi:hypothetical protein